MVTRFHTQYQRTHQRPNRSKIFDDESLVQRVLEDLDQFHQQHQGHRHTWLDRTRRTRPLQQGGGQGRHAKQQQLYDALIHLNSSSDPIYQHKGNQLRRPYTLPSFQAMAMEQEQGKSRRPQPVGGGALLYSHQDPYRQHPSYPPPPAPPPQYYQQAPPIPVGGVIDPHHPHYPHHHHHPDTKRSSWGLSPGGGAEWQRKEETEAAGMGGQKPQQGTTTNSTAVGPQQQHYLVEPQSVPVIGTDFIHQQGLLSPLLPFHQLHQATYEEGGPKVHHPIIVGGVAAGSGGGGASSPTSSSVSLSPTRTRRSPHMAPLPGENLNSKHNSTTHLHHWSSSPSHSPHFNTTTSHSPPTDQAGNRSTTGIPNISTLQSISKDVTLTTSNLNPSNQTTTIAHSPNFIPLPQLAASILLCNPNQIQSITHRNDDVDYKQLSQKVEVLYQEQNKLHKEQKKQNQLLRTIIQKLDDVPTTNNNKKQPTVHTKEKPVEIRTAATTKEASGPPQEVKDEEEEEDAKRKRREEEERRKQQAGMDLFASIIPHNDKAHHDDQSSSSSSDDDTNSMQSEGEAQPAPTNQNHANHNPQNTNTEQKPKSNPTTTEDAQPKEVPVTTTQPGTIFKTQSPTTAAHQLMVTGIRGLHEEWQQTRNDLVHKSQQDVISFKMSCMNAMEKVQRMAIETEHCEEWEAIDDERELALLGGDDWSLKSEAN